MKKLLLLMMAWGGLTMMVLAQKTDCEYMIEDANRYFSKGEYQKALTMYNMLNESNCMDASAKIKECTRLI